MDQPLTSTNGSTATINMQIVDVTATQLIINYNSLPGNMPNAYKNSIVVYPGNLFPFGATYEPSANAAITSNAASGTVVVPCKLMVGTTYQAGYAVGGKLASPAQPYGNVCAVATIPASGSDYPVQQSTLAVTYVSPTVVSAMYDFCPGFEPNVNGAWIGLWQGVINLYSIAPMAVQQIASNASSGSTAISATLMRGATYTLGLFTSGWAQKPVQTALAATCTFTT